MVRMIGRVVGDDGEDFDEDRFGPSRKDLGLFSFFPLPFASIARRGTESSLLNLKLLADQRAKK